MLSRYSQVSIILTKNPQFQVPTFISDANIYLCLFRFYLLIKKMQNTRYLPHNLNEKTLQFGFYTSIFDPESEFIRNSRVQVYTGGHIVQNDG